MRLEIRMPAKVNLALLVGPTRADGYHELLSVLVPIDVFDDLKFDLVARQSSQGRGCLEVRCEVAAGEDNLVARALRSLEKASGWAMEGRIDIGKGIPTGAGLGGGSSDAAAALRAGAKAIVAAGGRAPGEDLLQTLARDVGADVPFFLRPQPSIAQGIGELLEPIRLPPLPLVLVFSEAQLSTPRVYEEFDRIAGTRPEPATGRAAANGAAGEPAATRAEMGGEAPAAEAAFSERAGAQEKRWRALAAEWSERETGSEGTVGAVAGLLQNDLEQASFHLLPGLRGDKEVLTEEGALGAVMSGSGPTVLGLCRSRPDAEDTAARLRRRGYQARAAWGMQETNLP